MRPSGCSPPAAIHAWGDSYALERADARPDIRGATRGTDPALHRPSCPPLVDAIVRGPGRLHRVGVATSDPRVAGGIAGRRVRPAAGVPACQPEQAAEADYLPPRALGSGGSPRRP